MPRFVEDVFAFVASEKHKEEEAVAGMAPPSARTLTEAEAAEARPLLVESRIDRSALPSSKSTPASSTICSVRWLHEKDKGEKEYGAVLSLELDPARSGAGARRDATGCAVASGPSRTRARPSRPSRFDVAAAHGVPRAERGRRARTASFAAAPPEARGGQAGRRARAWSYVLQPSKTSTSTTRANLVDLAGSEDQRDTQSSGSTLREAADINRSLFTLRKAIEHLALKKHSRAVFQEETLTKLLASSLLGQAYALMIATISPLAAAARHTRNTRTRGRPHPARRPRPRPPRTTCRCATPSSRRRTRSCSGSSSSGRPFQLEKLRELEKQGGGGMGVGGPWGVEGEATGARRPFRTRATRRTTCGGGGSLRCITSSPRC